jgi:hypothetical protein
MRWPPPIVDASDQARLAEELLAQERAFQAAQLQAAHAIVGPRPRKPGRKPTPPVVKPVKSWAQVRAEQALRRAAERAAAPETRKPVKPPRDFPFLQEELRPPRFGDAFTYYSGLHGVWPALECALDDVAGSIPNGRWLRARLRE